MGRRSGCERVLVDDPVERSFSEVGFLSIRVRGSASEAGVAFVRSFGVGLWLAGLRGLLWPWRLLGLPSKQQCQCKCLFPAPSRLCTGNSTVPSRTCCVQCSAVPRLRSPVRHLRSDDIDGLTCTV